MEPPAPGKTAAAGPAGLIAATPTLPCEACAFSTSVRRRAPGRLWLAQQNICQYNALGWKPESGRGACAMHEDAPLRHVSTRGEAPPLGFVEVMLVGLAHDGGLYVPEAWPRFDASTIAGFAGRPYAEVATEVLQPLIGDDIPAADLARMAREAYGTFRHPAVAPLVQLGVNNFVLELFRGPTLAFKDLAMQLIARLMDYVLAQRGERTTIVVATSGDTGGAST